MKSYPSSDLTTALVAESIRQEAGGKFTVIGLYIDGKVLLVPPFTLPAVLPLSVVFIFRDGVGKFGVSARIKAPSGKIVLEAPLGETEKDPNLAHTLVIQVGAFPVEELGEYLVIMKLDDREYSTPISFAEGPIG